MNRVLLLLRGMQGGHATLSFLLFPCRYDFPPRVEAVQEVITLVQGHPRHHILLGVDSLGKGVSDSP